MSFKNILSLILISVIFTFLFLKIFSEWQDVRAQILSLNLLKVAAALILSLPIFFFNTLTWHLITKMLKINLSFRANLKIWLISNTARFLPGGFWQYPSRVYLLSEQKVPKLRATACLLLEALANLGVGAVVVLLIFNQILWLLIFSLTGSVFILLFKRRLAEKFPILKSLNISLNGSLLLSLTIFLQYFFAGLALFTLVNGLIPLSLTYLPAFVGVFTASWLLGYVVIIAPSGLGVQEASIATLLSVYLPFSLAGVVAIIFRLILLMAEAVVLLFTILILDRLLDLKIAREYNRKR